MNEFVRSLVSVSLPHRVYRWSLSWRAWHAQYIIENMIFASHSDIYFDNCPNNFRKSDGFVNVMSCRSVRYSWIHRRRGKATITCHLNIRQMGNKKIRKKSNSFWCAPNFIFCGFDFRFFFGWFRSFMVWDGFSFQFDARFKICPRIRNIYLQKNLDRIKMKETFQWILFRHKIHCLFENIKSNNTSGLRSTSCFDNWTRL